MKYIKLYEEFKFDQEIVEPEVQTDTTTDDVLKDDFFREEEREESEEVYKDEKGVYHIKDWNVY